ncbi:conserved hypothetical protein [Rippkaea orientalis PCC 8801]|uniref:Uncharacterized protein n=1 Tax=Rippkaea orientalis (strain PCC 8801 / RF-1) TaxID=41431 RepID=B7K4X0_RIPO1|nr:hypothetical protein [Rippkaea orientalis]ACK66626.1 conserved hypothetical protein [Rippkaea orientalis PCC 8801]
MLKYLVCLLLLILSFFLATPVEASFCREIDGQSICIETIKRSAKNYWEYRASVKVDGVVKPIEIYNCRDRVIIEKDKTIIPFENNGVGDLICNLLKK